MRQVQTLPLAFGVDITLKVHKALWNKILSMHHKNKMKLNKTNWVKKDQNSQPHCSREGEGALSHNECLQTQKTDNKYTNDLTYCTYCFLPQLLQYLITYDWEILLP